MTQRKDVVTFADIIKNLDQIPKGDPFARGRGPADPLRERAMADALAAPQLAARVRELEAERDHERALLECAPWATYSEGETLLRAQAAEAQQLAKQMMDERDKLRAECAALRRELAALMDDH
jgi:hypothetical protein